MIDYHSLKVKIVLSHLKTGENGLAQDEAQKRLKKYGYNELPKEKSLSQAAILASQFNSALVYILIIAGVLSLILKSTTDALVIFSAVILNIIIGYVQENKANQAIAILRKLVEHKAYVLRGGQELLVDSRQLTIGDIIMLNAGNRVPVDARIIEAAELEADESGLTGEAMPAHKETAEIAAGFSLPDRNNMVYAGTVIVSGHGRAAVTAVGAKTEFGRIAQTIKETKEEKTPLQTRLDKFSRQLGVIFAVVCLIIVMAGLIQGRSLLTMINTGVAVGVASIPEGLTIAVTVILALGMRKILKEKALTRRLVAAETLGSATVICTDKTGTLTEGKMHVDHIIIGDEEYKFADLDKRRAEKELKTAYLALETAMACNSAFIENPTDELAAWRIVGSPTDTALLAAAIQSGLSQKEFIQKNPKIQEMPFSSDQKYMITLHRRNDGNYVLYAKGAPEKLLPLADKFYNLNGLIRINGRHLAKLNTAHENLTKRGLRVLGLATREIEKHELEQATLDDKIDWRKIGHKLTFVGFIAIKDPLRPEAKTTIKLARAAGIKPIIITGDHKLTAKAIAEEVGLSVKSENIVTGDELDKIDDEKLLKIVKKIDLYARVSPHHKLRIVKALQARGEVVAMTGDGINDSPALKAAHIGISLGTGTDIAKETSDIVLLDDNFATIISAIKQGRIIFKNIRKVITFLLSDSFSEMTLIIGSILFNLPLAILPTQILWINIVNDGFPNFSLAKEKGSDAVMLEPPIKRDEPILNAQMKYIIFVAGITRDIILFLIFMFILSRTSDIAYLRTLIFVTLGVKSLMTIFSLRAFSKPIWRINPFGNKHLLAAVAISACLLIAGVYTGPAQKILSTVPLRPSAWLISFSIGILSIGLIETVKFYFIRKNRKNFRLNSGFLPADEA